MRSTPGRPSASPSPAPTSSAPCPARSPAPSTTPRSGASTARPIGSFQAVQHLLADAHVADRGVPRSVALHAAWAVDALPADDALAAAVGGQGLLRPGGPHGRARPPSRSTAASATPGSAWPTSTSGGRCSSSDVLGGVGPNLDRVLAHHGLGGDRWTSVTPRTRRRSVAVCGTGWSTTTPGCRRRRPTTRTGKARPRGTSRSTTPASSASRGRSTSAARGCRASTT